MKNPLLPAIGLAFALATPLLSQTPGLGTTPDPFVAFSNGVLPISQPGSSTGWSIENAFVDGNGDPTLDFVDPMGLVQIPGTTGGTTQFVVVQKNGVIYRFFKDPAQYGDGTIDNADLVTVLDVSAATQTGEDMGFYTLVFHPNFGVSGQTGENYAYVCYNHKPNLSGTGVNDSYWRLSRFTWLPGSGTFDAGSENVLINQYDPQQWHNGGAMFFDNEGFLNFSVGDGEFEYWHQNEHGPINGAFFGGIFRIDVDNDVSKSHAIRRQPVDIPDGNGYDRPAGWPASSTQGYSIPDTNPWLDAGGSILEEFVVHGLRSPHTVSYDPVKNQMWCGDVGGGAREELSRFVLGDNGQWPIREGINGGNEPGGSIGAWTPPVIDYGHGGTTYNGVTMNGASIIGGMRYRGTKWNATFNGDTVLFADITVGKIWAIALDGNDDAILDGTSGEPLVELITDQGIKNGGKSGLANFCTDEEGEIYLMELNGQNNAGGRIKKLVTAGIAQEPPLYLSDTGLFNVPNTTNPFSSTGDLPTSTGVIPFDVANPLWSDAAHKFRWIALPNDGSHDTAAEQITFDEEYNWVFPAGTVVIKHFELDTDLDPGIEVIKRLETRLIVCTENGGFYGVTYKWNAAGTEAVRMGGIDPLNEPDGLSENVTMTNNGSAAAPQNWDYPSRSQCFQCHNEASGQVLGFRTTQLNRDYHYDSTGITSNQLYTYDALGMFDQTLSTTQIANFIESRAIDDDTAPLEHRVRSYLDSNCSHCHQFGGRDPYFDARLGTPLTLQGIVNVALTGHNSNLFPASGRYIKPNDIANSVMHTRLNAQGNAEAMPPLAKNLVDTDAVALFAQYIGSINDADFTVTAPAEARYVRLMGLSEVNGKAWTSVAEFEVLDGSGNPITGITVVDYDSAAGGDPATNVVDGTNDFWHTPYGGGEPLHPHYVTVDLGSLQEISGYRYTPRQGNANGRIANYEVHYTTDSSFSTSNWALMDSGTWANNGDVKTFNGPITGIRKARCEIAGPTNLPGGGAPVEVTIVFDSDVDDFTAGDLQVAGGTVTALRGSGYYYVATVTPTVASLNIQVPADVANSSLLGNLASNSLVIGNDIFGPIATFTGVPAGGLIVAPVTLGIEFDEVPTGFSAGSLSASNATLSGFSGSGLSYTILVTPTAEGAILVTLDKAGITDSLSNPMDDSVTANLTYDSELLEVEAEDGILAGDMVIVNDIAASGGSYIELTNDGGTPEIFNPSNSATYTFIIPTTGNWILEGLIRAPDTSSNSFWVEIDGGATHQWDTHVSATFAWDQLNSVPSASTTLIGPAISNGDFEFVDGATSATKIQEWDGDPAGEIDNWTQLSGNTGDSGTEVNGGSRIGFFENGNHAFNITDTPHPIAVGDVIDFSFENDGNNGDIDVQLGAWDGDTNTPGVALFGTQSVSAGAGTYNGVQYTVTAGDTAILGETLTIVAGSTGEWYPHIDNVVLTVTSNIAPIDPLVHNLTAGIHTVTVYGREAGTQLDDLRFVPDGGLPAVTLTAPATVESGLDVDVSVSFTSSVTGLISGDFTVTDATVGALSGSGTSYTLTVSPTGGVGSTVGVTLPASSVTEGNTVSNTTSTSVIAPPSTVENEAEAGTLAGGMAIVNDVGASNGSYIWLAEGTAPGNEDSFNAANSASYTFDLPYAGNWILEGLMSADSATSDSFWVQVDGTGTVYDWDLDESLTGFNWEQLNHNTTATTTLIDAVTNNGSFELLGGVASTAKATHWDTDNDGDVDNWTLWDAAAGGPATNSNNSGTDASGAATEGTHVGFLQGDNAAYNLTGHVIAEGDVFIYSWDWVLANRGDATAQLAYWNGSTATAIAGTETSAGAVVGTYGTTYTVLNGDPAIGSQMAMTIATTGNFPEVDNFVLTVTSALPPVDPVILNLAAGTHTVVVYAKEDGAKLDALRFVSESPTVVLTAPAVVTAGNNFDVDVAFSEAVTGLVSGDFTISGATVSGLTGSGTSYTLTLTPTGSSVDVTLPADSAVDGDTNGNIVSNTTNTTVNDAPTVVLTAPGVVASGASFDVDVTFSESVTGLVSGDFTVTGATVDSLTGSGASYTLSVTATGATVNVTLPVDSAVDGDGAGNLVSNTTATTANTAPDVTLTAPDVVVGSGTVDVAVVFSESVTGLTSGDFTISGATASGLTGSGASYTLTLAPTGSSVSVTLPADSAIDGDSAGNTASNTEVIEIRTTFDQWAIDNGLGAPVDYSDDPNGDGLTLLHGFLLNLDPNAFGAPIFNPANGPTGLPLVTATDIGSGVRRLQIEFPRNAQAIADGYQYVGQFSDDFVTWEDVTGGTVVTPLDAEWDHVMIEDTATSTTKTKRFGRLKLVAP